jgi:uncharacterized membrane protein (UPF0127 family)
LRRIALAAAMLAACGGGEVDLVGPDGAVVHAYTNVEYATTPDTRAQGLVGHAALGPSDAMVLEYPVVDQACITNAQVDFAITAIFVDGSGKIVGVDSLAAHDANIPCHDGVLDVVETDASGATFAAAASSVTFR